MIGHINLQKGYGGGEIQTLLLCENLQKSGIKLILIVHSEGRLLREAKNRGIRTISLSGSVPSMILKLKSLIDVFRFEIVHGHDGKAQSVLAFLKIFILLQSTALKVTSNKLKIAIDSRIPPVIITRRVSFIPGLNPVSWLKRKFIDRIICISPSVARISRKSGFKRKQITVIPSAVRKQFYDVKRNRELFLDSSLNIFNEKNYIIVSTGKLASHKGQEDLIRALKIILDKLKSQEGNKLPLLILAGEGPDRKRLENLSEKLAVSESVFFTGNRNDVHILLSKADLFAFASGCEGLGGAVIEAMASGVPVVAYNVPGVSDALSKGGGILVEHGNVKNLAAAMTELLRNKRLSEKTGETGRKIAESIFSPQKVMNRHIQLYKEITGSGHNE